MFIQFNLKLFLSFHMLTSFDNRICYFLSINTKSMSITNNSSDPKAKVKYRDALGAGLERDHSNKSAFP